MYSPVPRTVRETRWAARDAAGRWVPVTGPGASAEHRRERSLAAALLWDFKRARIHDNYFITRYVDELPQIYVLAARDQITRELGEPPRALRATVYGAPIPTPDSVGDWTPESAAPATVLWEQVFE